MLIYHFTNFGALETALGVQFANQELLAQAFVHSSYANEHSDVVGQSNERLEFLGDAVLQLIASEELFSRYHDLPEGALTRLRSQIVDTRACAAYLDALNVGSYLLLGRGEQGSDRGRTSMHADLFEAIVGALFLDGGLDAAREFVLRCCAETIAVIAQRPLCNFKSELQDYAQREFHEPPHYRVVSESGPDHDKHFSIEVLIGGDVVGWGNGPSKKQAQQAAAEDAIRRME